MSGMKERDPETVKEEHGRRGFLKLITKYLLGFSAFGIASLFGLRRNGEIRLGKMRNYEVGLSEAYGECSYGASCAGGGECSYGSSCGGSGDGGGGGECSYGASCAGGGGGQCSYGSNCAGGGGQCSYGSSCAGGGGQCSYGSNCAGG